MKLSYLMLACMNVMSVAALVSGAPLESSVDLVSTSVATLDQTFNPGGPVVDVYHVTLTNPNPDPATALEFDFTGNFVNNLPGSNPFTFNYSTNLASLGPFSPFAESFFVLPPETAGLTVLAVATVDDNTTLKSAYSLPGSPTLVPANGSAVVAVISVPTGAMLNTTDWTGNAIVGNSNEPIALHLFPEPSSLVLATLPLAVGLIRRR